MNDYYKIMIPVFRKIGKKPIQKLTLFQGLLIKVFDPLLFQKLRVKRTGSIGPAIGKENRNALGKITLDPRLEITVPEKRSTIKGLIFGLKEEAAQIHEAILTTLLKAIE